MLVEEAGQVLEAHVLGSLVESIEHLILIGDPEQLRSTLNNYGKTSNHVCSRFDHLMVLWSALSSDHRTGKKLYRFDMSLMERLATSGLPMSRLDVQRRMRPQISSLIRFVVCETHSHDKLKFLSAKLSIPVLSTTSVSTTIHQSED